MPAPLVDSSGTPLVNGSSTPLVVPDGSSADDCSCCESCYRVKNCDDDSETNICTTQSLGIGDGVRFDGQCWEVIDSDIDDPSAERIDSMGVSEGDGCSGITNDSSCRSCLDGDNYDDNEVVVEVTFSDIILCTSQPCRHTGSDYSYKVISFSGANSTFVLPFCGESFGGDGRLYGYSASSVNDCNTPDPGLLAGVAEQHNNTQDCDNFDENIDMYAHEILVHMSFDLQCIGNISMQVGFLSSPGTVSEGDSTYSVFGRTDFTFGGSQRTLLSNGNVCGDAAVAGYQGNAYVVVRPDNP